MQTLTAYEARNGRVIGKCGGSAAPKVLGIGVRDSDQQRHGSARLYGMPYRMRTTLQQAADKVRLTPYRLIARLDIGRLAADTEWGIFRHSVET